MLKVRKIVKTATSDNGSYGNYEGVYGQGASNFIYGGDALAQILTHQLLTVRGELPTRTDYGVDWFSKQNDQTKKTILDTQIKNILVNNYYVNNILSFSSSYSNNIYTANIKLATTEGLLELSI